MTSVRYGRRKQRLMAEINVVPYIDVMLVLLVIFMVTAPLLSTGIYFGNPETSSERTKKESQNSFHGAGRWCGSLFRSGECDGFITKSGCG
jgi:biopolymer transport protein TolR